MVNKYYSYYESPIGKLMLISDGDKLLCLKGVNHRYYDSFADGEVENDSLDVFVMTKNWLDKYFNGDKPSIGDVSFVLSGTSFQMEVWDILCSIPYGEVITYNDIAKKIAAKRRLKRMSSQAVGGAVGHNPLSIIVPCHRVVGSNNSLVGYGGGISMKVKLLELEGVDINKYTIPKKGTAL